MVLLFCERSSVFMTDTRLVMYKCNVESMMIDLRCLLHHFPQTFQLAMGILLIATAGRIACQEHMAEISWHRHTEKF